MLKVSFGKPTEKILWDIDPYFNFNFEHEWLQDDLVKRMIKDIDKSEVLNIYHIQDPVLGQISPWLLSKGVKALILAFNEPNLYINGSACGDNCAKWWLEIGKVKDIRINLGHIMHFDGEFEIYIENSDKIVHNMSEFISEEIKYN
ncbi:MAG: DUF4869 domain-containing protein [Lachnospiraceae bacterium]|nr:DUF4869 domain-containing protein [Lachnospiraceae bacterium]